MKKNNTRTKMQCFLVITALLRNKPAFIRIEIGDFVL